MRQKVPTIVQKAKLRIKGFENVFKVIHQNTVLKGQSKSTFHNYLRRIALISLHFDRLPENISDDEINEYLTSLALDPKSPSRSSFKHMVYGLRYYFRHIGQNKLSIDFRSHMMKQLKKQLSKGNQLNEYQGLINKAWAKNWVVFCEPSFAGADRVIKYLGQYTHKVAISNHRLQDIDDKNVSFLYKDYRDGSKGKLTRMPGVGFLRRFSMHILPKGFVKIRYYGILSNRFGKQTAMYRTSKANPEKESVQQRIQRLTGFDVYKCPYCKKGHMHTIEELPRIRSPMRFMQPMENPIQINISQ